MQYFDSKPFMSLTSFYFLIINYVLNKLKSLQSERMWNKNIVLTVEGTVMIDADI